MISLSYVIKKILNICSESMIRKTLNNNLKLYTIKRRVSRQGKSNERCQEKNSVIFDGCQLYHNYIRPHMSLDGGTPAEACGIKIKGQNKWLTLIQNSSVK